MLFATCNNACTSSTPSDTSKDMTNNGACEDGGEDSVSSVCTLGNDCLDCGPRLTYQSPDPPSPPFSPCVEQELKYFTSQRMADTYCTIQASHYLNYKCVVAPASASDLAASSETFTCYDNSDFQGVCVDGVNACPLRDVTEQEHCQQLCAALADCKAYIWYADNDECYPMMNVYDYVVNQFIANWYGAVGCVRTWYHDVHGVTLNVQSRSRVLMDYEEVDVALALAPRAIGDYKDVHTELSIFDAKSRSERLGEMLRTKRQNLTGSRDANGSVPYAEAKRQNMARQAAMQAYRDRKPHRERMALQHIASNRSRRELRHKELIYCWPDGRQFNDLYEGEEDPINTYIGYERCGSQVCTPGVDDPQLCQDTAEGYGCFIPTEECCQAQYQLSYTDLTGGRVQFLCSWRYEYERGHTFRWENGYDGYVDCGLFLDHFDEADSCRLLFSSQPDHSLNFVPLDYFYNYDSVSQSQQRNDYCPTARTQMQYCCSEVCALWPVPSSSFYGAPEVYPFQPDCRDEFGHPHQWSIAAHSDPALPKNVDGTCKYQAFSPPPPTFDPADQGLTYAIEIEGYTFIECPASPFAADAGAPSEACCLQACQSNYYIQSDLCQQYYGDCVILNDYTGFVDCTAAYWWWPQEINNLIQCCDDQCELSNVRYGFPMASLGCLSNPTVPPCGTKLPSPSPSRPPPSSPPPPPPPPGPRFPPATNVYSVRECMLDIFGR